MNVNNKLTELPHPNTVSLLDKSVWTALSVDEHAALNFVSTIALAPVLYEEIRAELAPRKERRQTPETRLATAADKAFSYRTYPLPAAWKLTESELTRESLLIHRGIPVDMQYIVDGESKGLIFDQNSELYDFQRWSLQRKGSSQEINAARNWRRHMEQLKSSNNNQSTTEEETPHNIQLVYDQAKAEISNAVTHTEGLANALVLLGFPRARALGLARPWGNLSHLCVERDAPYTIRSITLELFMRKVVMKWPWRWRNRADLMYFHYLPFCDMFFTADKIQRRFAEPWLGSKQQCFGSRELRSELEELRVMQSIGKTDNRDFPPRNSNGLFAKMLDEIRPEWRGRRSKSLSPDQLRRLNESGFANVLQKKLDKALERGVQIPARRPTKGELNSKT